MIHKPMRIIYRFTPDGDMSINLMPWIVGNLTQEDSYKVYSSDIITYANASDSLIEGYYRVLKKFATIETEVPKEEEEEEEENLSFEEDIKRGKRTLQ